MGFLNKAKAVSNTTTTPTAPSSSQSTQSDTTSSPNQTNQTPPQSSSTQKSTSQPAPSSQLPQEKSQKTSFTNSPKSPSGVSASNVQSNAKSQPLEQTKNVGSEEKTENKSSKSGSASQVAQTGQNANSQSQKTPVKDRVQSELALKTKKVVSEQDDAYFLSPEEIELKREILKIPIDTQIRTVADDILDQIVEQKRTTFAKLVRDTGASLADVEKICSILATKGHIQIRYPLIFTLSPEVIFKSLPKSKVKTYELDDAKTQLDSYLIFSDFTAAKVTIWTVPRENTPIYDIVEHDVGMGTLLVIDEIIDNISQSISSDFFDSTDVRKYYSQKHKFFLEALKHVKQFFASTEEITQYMLAGKILQNSIGLGKLDVILADNWLEEVAINAKNEPLSVYHKRYAWLKSTLLFSQESEVYNIAIQIGRKVGKQITSLEPIMDAHMQTGDRVAATLFPISTEGDTLTIRRFSRNPWTIVHMIDEKNHTLSKDIMAFMWLAMQYELNLMVVGGTASGKTSVLNTMSSLIPPTNRILSIEDTREISLPNALHWNWVALSSKAANSEGQGEVSMLDLMVAALRMRPDRIIVGEIRKKAQAEALFEAMHTGHAVSATMHADTSEQIKHRLTQPPIDIPENEIQALQLIMVQYRDRRRGVRRTLEVAELLPGSNDEKVTLNYLFRWRARSDTFAVDEQSIRVVEDLNLHTGMTEKDIQNDLAEKKSVLEWLLKNKIYDIDEVGEVLRIYYKHPKLLIDNITDDSSFESVVTQSHETAKNQAESQNK
jgi:archaeal flagellar protein FlaI